jgi:hypothetical protein
VDEFLAASAVGVVEDAVRHEFDHTPAPDFDMGVENDFSLPVVDLESSATLECDRSRLDRVEKLDGCSTLLVSAEATSLD